MFSVRDGLRRQRQIQSGNRKKRKERERNCVVTHVTKPIQCPKDQCSPPPSPSVLPELIDKQEEKGKGKKKYPRVSVTAIASIIDTYMCNILVYALEIYHIISFFYVADGIENFSLLPIS